MKPHIVYDLDQLREAREIWARMGAALTAEESDEIQINEWNKIDPALRGAWLERERAEHEAEYYPTEDPVGTPVRLHLVGPDGVDLRP